MNIPATSPEDYLSKVPEDRQAIMTQMRETIKNNLPSGFQEQMSYGMIGFVVPHEVYPAGYHCDTKLPLPFINLASQKNFIALYHLGIYASDDLMEWFVSEYPKYCKRKLDMGKSCIRFKKVDDIPIDLIGELVTKMSAEEWITLYEKNVKR